MGLVNTHRHRKARAAVPKTGDRPTDDALRTVEDRAERAETVVDSLERALRDVTTGSGESASQS